MKQSINALLSVLTLTFFVTACGQDKPSVSAPAADEVSNAPVVPELNSRVTYQGSKVGLKSSGEERAIQGDGKKDEVEFEYLVSASAPKGPISGELLQATNFDFAGKYGFVSYNTAGEIIEGALDIVIVEKKSYVDIKASLLFDNAEFADVKVEGEFAYLVGAQSGAEEGAVLVVVNISNIEKPEEVSRVSLPGHYATGIILEKNVAYVTSGDDAGVVVVDLSDPSMPAIKEVYKLENALSISEVKGTLYTLGGYDGTFLFNDLSFESRWDISKDRSDAPSRMASDEHSIYINAQHSGLSIVDLKADQIVSRMDLEGTGNGIDVSTDHLFLAQGEAGLQVVNVKNSEAPRLLGALDFPDDRGSANQVRYSISNKVIFLADGMGGFRVICFESSH